LTKRVACSLRSANSFLDPPGKLAKVLGDGDAMVAMKIQAEEKDGCLSTLYGGIEKKNHS
jgi:hypothetical protein